MNGVWIILDSIDGEVDREFVREGDSIAEAIKELLDGDWANNLKTGDKIRIAEGWIEFGPGRC